MGGMGPRGGRDSMGGGGPGARGMRVVGNG